VPIDGCCHRFLDCCAGADHDSAVHLHEHDAEYDHYGPGCDHVGAEHDADHDEPADHNARRRSGHDHSDDYHADAADGDSGRTAGGDDD